MGLVGMPPEKFTKLVLTISNEEKPTTITSNVKGLKCRFLQPSTYSRATWPGRVTRWPNSEMAPWSTCVNACTISWLISCRDRRLVLAFCPHREQNSCCRVSGAEQSRQKGGAIFELIIYCKSSSCPSGDPSNVRLRHRASRVCEAILRNSLIHCPVSRIVSSPAAKVHVSYSL